MDYIGILIIEDQTDWSLTRPPISLGYNAGNLNLELKCPKETAFQAHFECRLLWHSSEIILRDGEKQMTYCGITNQGLWGKTQGLGNYHLLEYCPEEGRYLVAIDRRKAEWTPAHPLQIILVANDGSWIYDDDDPVHTLVKNEISPGKFGWLRLELSESEQ